MLFLKIITPLIVILLTLIQYFLEHKYTDRRSKKYRRTRQIFITVICTALIFSSFTIYLDNKSSEKVIQRLEEINKFSLLSDSLANLREKNAVSERKSLLNEIDELNSQLVPFLEIATKMYPELDSLDALNKLQSEIKGLQKRTSELEHKTEYIESRTRYKPLSQDLKSSLVMELKYIHETFPDLKIVIESESGNVLRRQIAESIKNIFLDSGFQNVNARDILSFGGSITDNLSIRYNESDNLLVNLLFKPFVDYYFKKAPVGKPLKNSEKNLFTIYIGGNPLIEKDGRVSF